MTAVLIGTPSTGFVIYGPFDDQEKAIAWAEQHTKIHFWEIIELLNPEAEDEVE